MRDMNWDGRIKANSLQIPLADESVHCVVTSPPYWGLRRYDVEGDQLGSEKTPEEYVARMVTVFKEVKRVLRKDGSLWLNLGDSYASGKGTCFNPGGGGGSLGKDRKAAGVHPLDRGNKSTLAASGLKPKDLCGMPWRVAFALQADGWYLRSDIVWAKKNTMPESTKDRPTRSHEFIFLLTKSPRYFYDAEAIKEPASSDSHARYARGRNQSAYPGQQTIASSFDGMRPPSWKGSSFNKGKTAVNGLGRNQTEERRAGVHPKAPASNSGIKQNESFSAAVKDTVEWRNKRDVWFIGSAAFPEAHYATFPPALIEPCILAGTSEHGVCSECGAPYNRSIEPSEEYAKFLGKGFHDHSDDKGKGMMQSRGKNRQNKHRDETGNHRADYVTTGWTPSCLCRVPRSPAIVLDPFFGSGTTGVVAESLSRRWIGLDLGYQEMQKRRLKNIQKELPCTRS